MKLLLRLDGEKRFRSSWYTILYLASVRLAADLHSADHDGKDRYALSLLRSPPPVSSTSSSQADLQQQQQQQPNFALKNSEFRTTAILREGGGSGDAAESLENVSIIWDRFGSNFSALALLSTRLNDDNEHVIRFISSALLPIAATAVAALQFHPPHLTPS